MATPNPDSDLTTPEGVQRYLSQTQFAASNVTLLSRGLSNFTYRITLRQPYDRATGSQARAPVPVHTMVLKHAEPYVASDSSFSLDVARQEYESLAFKHIPGIISPSVVHLPTLYHEDREHQVLVMSDCGEASTTLKTLLQTSPPVAEISRTIGHSLGTFLARLHTATLTPKTTSAPTAGFELKTLFGANKQGRSISAYITYGRVVETLTDQDLITPPLDLSPSQLATIKVVSKTMQDRIMSSDDVLTMGDFWPGNFIVSFDPDWASEAEVRVDVIDWELAKPGIAGLDIGQCLAELVQMRSFHPSSRMSVDIIISAFLTAYREVVRGTGETLEIVDVARVAATHIGAHLIAWTPRIPWGGKEKTREVVSEGVEYIVRAVESDEAWLKTSVVGALLE